MFERLRLLLSRRTVVLVSRHEAEALASAVVLLRVACVMPTDELETL